MLLTREGDIHIKPTTHVTMVDVLFLITLNNNWNLIIVNAKANQFAGFSIRLELVFCYKKIEILVLVTKHLLLLSTITTVKMSKQIAPVNWRRGRYSDVFRTAIVDPSPIKQGQKVWVVWGKTKKEYTAVLSCYPVNDENEPESSKDEQQPRRVKWKLVSFYLS